MQQARARSFCIITENQNNMIKVHNEYLALLFLALLSVVSWAISYTGMSLVYVPFSPMAKSSSCFTISENIDRNFIWLQLTIFTTTWKFKEYVEKMVLRTELLKLNQIETEQMHLIYICQTIWSHSRQPKKNFGK